jgi:hypothetical protein
MAKSKSINGFLLFGPLCSVQKYIFLLKLQFWLKIVIISIKNCNTFSVVPSVINENAKKCAVPLNEAMLLPPQSFTSFLPSFDETYI